MKIEEMEGLMNRVGGRFKLTVLVQKRLRELCRGAQPLVETTSRNLIEVALEEILAGKVSFLGDDLPEEKP